MFVSQVSFETLWLISDCKELIDWPRQFELYYDLTGEEERPKSIAKSIHDDLYVGYQLTLAYCAENGVGWAHEQKDGVNNGIKMTP